MDGEGDSNETLKETPITIKGNFSLAPSWGKGAQRAGKGLLVCLLMKLNLVSEAELSQLRDIVAGAERVLVLGHTNPDGDAMGSTMTWAEYLRQQGKEATVVVPDMFPDFL